MVALDTLQRFGVLEQRPQAIEQQCFDGRYAAEDMIDRLRLISSWLSRSAAGTLTN
jgi:hypothetical protein